MTNIGLQLLPCQSQIRAVQDPFHQILMLGIVLLYLIQPDGQADA
jgi:hypothetical protein